MVSTSILVLSCVLMGANALDDEALPTSNESQAGGGFIYWLLDSFMWAVALYYVITRRAEFVQLFQRVAVRFPFSSNFHLIDASIWVT